MKRLVFLGTSRGDLSDLPREVRIDFGYALYVAQTGGKHPSAKPMKGMPVVEIVSQFDGSAFRAMYTIKFGDAVYVLHAFQKKSKSGIATPKPELELIERRLKELRSAVAEGRDPT
jgi:phage-related protein